MKWKCLFCITMKPVVDRVNVRVEDDYWFFTTFGHWFHYIPCIYTEQLLRAIVTMTTVASLVVTWSASSSYCHARYPYNWTTHLMRMYFHMNYFLWLFEGITNRQNNVRHRHYGVQTLCKNLPLSPSYPHVHSRPDCLTCGPFWWSLR